MDSVTFTDPTVVGFAQDFVFVKVDGKVDTLLEQKLGISGHPTNILFTPDGKEIDRLLGYYPPDSFLVELKNYLAGKNTLGDYLKRVKANPDDLSLHYALGEKYSSRKDFSSARTHYQRVVKLDAGNKEGLADDATYYLAYLLRKEKKWPEAIDGFRLMIKEYPDSELREDAEVYVPWLYAQAGDDQQAVKYYREFLTNFPESEEVDWVKKQIDKIENPEAEE